jgi:hypothetical protein
MKRFRESASGRVITAAVALPLATAAFATGNAGGSGFVWCMASVFAAVMLAVIAIGLAFGDYEREVLGAILTLPPGLLLYIPLVGIADAVPAVRLAMGLAAVVLVGVASAGALSRLRLASSPRVSTHPA